MTGTSGTSGTPVRPQVFKVLCTAIGRMKGIVGTDKAEVDAEAEKEQRRKAKSKGKNPKRTK